jgi:hypothetical protein
MNNFTRPSSLTSADIEKIVAAISKTGGASVRIQDPRVSQFQNWLIGIFGAGMVGSALWLANSVSDLKILAERQTVQFEQLDRRVSRLEGARP